MNDVCFVLFRSGDCDLARGLAAIQSPKREVIQQGDVLIVRASGLCFSVRLVESEAVQVQAREIAEGSEHGALAQCDARFEIEIDDLDAALDDINELMELQGALQDASRGYLFLPWNGNIQAPWLG